MPRVYKTREGAKKRVPIDGDLMKRGVGEVLSGKPIKGTAKAYGINIMTLKRYVRKARQFLLAQNDVAPSVESVRTNTTAEAPGTSTSVQAPSTLSTDIAYIPNYRQSQIFNDCEEKELVAYLIRASKLHHGLSPKSMRQMAFQYALKNGKNISQEWVKNECASYDWYYGFVNIRHKQFLSLRTPEATSLSRATAFNRHNVQQFFDNLSSLYQRHNFSANRIWNVDETGITTVHKPKKVLAAKGMKQVSQVTSGERGQLVTVCGAINASGNHLPPFMIFPRKNWQIRMIDGGPPGTEGACHPSGWMTGPNFLSYLEFFKKHAMPNLANPHLIIFDNHESHITIDSINFCKENGIHLLTIPPHTSQKLQPLDRIVFGTLKSYYNAACDHWMLNHPGRPLTIYDLAGCLKNAYPDAMSPRNIQKSFEITGIFPFNSDIFTEDEFLSSYVTDRESDLTVNMETLRNPSPSVLSGIPVIPTPEINSISCSKTTSSGLIPQMPSCNLNAEDTTQLNSALTLPSSSTVNNNILATTSKQCISDTLNESSLSIASHNTSIIQQILPENSATHSALSVSSASHPPTLINCAPSVASVTPIANSQLSAPAAAIRRYPNALSAPSTSFVSPEQIKPYPKAGPRKGTVKGRKRGRTRILTDTPEKLAIESEWKERQIKKQKASISKVKQVKRNLNAPAEDEVTTSEDEELPPSPDSVFSAVSEDDEMSSTESENDDYTATTLTIDDWVIVNFTSQKNLVHRYVGQIITTSNAEFVVKFAKKISEKSFKWPMKDDIAPIAKYQIIKKLPKPKLHSSSKRIISIDFPRSLRKFKIKN